MEFRKCSFHVDETIGFEKMYVWRKKKRVFFEAWQIERAAGPARPGTARLGLASGDDASDIRRCRKRNMERHTLKSIV